MINLINSLVFFDIESTGTKPATDKIITLYAEKHLPNGKIETLDIKVNPGVSIPPASTEVHKISDDDVKECMLFSAYAPIVYVFFAGCDLSTFNGNKFDIPLLVVELARCGITLDISGVSLVDVSVIDRKLRQRRLADVHTHWTGKTFENAHNAEADIIATKETLLAILEQNPELARDPAALELWANDGKKRLDLAGKFKYNDDGKIVFTFGKYIDKPLSWVKGVDRGYLDYLLKGESPKDFVKIITDAINWKPAPAPEKLDAGLFNADHI